MQITVITTMRDEGPFVLEWLTHLRRIGASHVIVFTNDCQDGTDRLLDAVAQLGWVTHIRQDIPAGKSPQWTALKTAWDHPRVKAADWVTVLDVDEFPDIHHGAGRFEDLIAACPGADGIVMPWRLFGNAGVVEFQDVPVTQQFMRCALEGTSYPIATTFFKSLIRRAGPFSGLGVHRPKQKNAVHHNHPVWFDGAGEPMPDFFAQNPKRLSLIGTTIGRSLVELRHYSLKSVEAFLIKQARGLPNRASKPIDLTYWVNRNFNRVTAEPLAVPVANWPKPIVAAHKDCVRWYQGKIAAALRSSEGYALYCDLVMVGDSKELAPSSAMHLYEMFQNTLNTDTDST